MFTVSVREYELGEDVFYTSNHNTVGEALMAASHFIETRVFGHDDPVSEFQIVDLEGASSELKLEVTWSHDTYLPDTDDGGVTTDYILQVVADLD